jgi:hypothetical protein
VLFSIKRDKVKPARDLGIQELRYSNNYSFWRAVAVRVILVNVKTIEAGIVLSPRICRSRVRARVCACACVRVVYTYVTKDVSGNIGEDVGKKVCVFGD